MNISNISNNAYLQRSENDASKAKLPSGAAAKNTVDAFEKAITGISVSFGDDSSKTVNNIKESISSIEEDIKSDAQLARDNLNALFNKLSGAEAVKLDEDGFDLNDVDDEELVGIVDRIKIMLAAYNTNYRRFEGALDSPDEDSVEASSDLSVKVAAKLEAANLPATEDNISEVDSAVMMAEDISQNMPLSDDAKEYLIDNELTPNVENVYKASHSVSAAGFNTIKSVSEKDWQEIKPQVKKVLEQAGIAESDSAYDNARWLMERELAVTGDNILMKEGLDKLSINYDEDSAIDAAVDAMLAGRSAADISPEGGKEAWRQAAEAISVINDITFSDIEDMVSNNRKFTIEEMSQQLIERNSTSEKTSTESKEPKDSNAAVENYRVLLEARVVMTASSTAAIINQGIDIYSEDLHNLVDILRANEANYVSEELNSEKYGKVSDEDLESVVNTTELMEGLKFTPAAAIGNMIAARTTLTVTSVTQTAFALRRSYEAAGVAYETMSTKARSDMGDSVKAAVDNSASSILSELGYEDNENNRRAVRILAYNNMEMTQDNINKVRSVDSTLNNLMENMTPQTVLKMIQDGINPLNTDIEVLNEYINENYANSEPSVKYSEFLYKLDRTGEITQEERRQFIGIYKMFHQLKKDGGKSAGALLSQGSDVTLGNLVTFMESRRRYGMDVTLDENAGMAEVTGNVAYFQNLFSELSKTITPQALKKADTQEGSLEDMSVEQLNELMEKYADADSDAKEEYFNEMVANARECQDIEDNVLRMITDQGIPVTFYNMMSANRLLGNNSRFGGRYYDELKNIRNVKVDNSITGILDSFDSKEDAQSAFDNLSQSINDTIEDIMESDSEDDYQDISRLKLLGKTAGFMTQLSTRNQYFIPIADNDELAGINLKLIKTGESLGKLEMRFETSELGNVYAEFTVSSSEAAGYFVSDSTQGVEKLKDSVDNIAARLKKLGINTVDINVSQGRDVPQITHFDDGEDTPTALIYKAAKEILLEV